MQLNENEAKVMNALFKSSAGNGHDFGYTDDVNCEELGITRRQLSGYVAQLSKKGYIELYYDEWNSFILTQKYWAESGKVDAFVV